MRGLLTATIVLLLCVSCKKEEGTPKITENKKQLYEKAGWLLGSWKNTSSKAVMTETWVHNSDSVYIGVSVVVEASDTVFSERIRLAERNEKLYYIVSVPGQNNEKPVAFLLTAASADKLIFENKDHDFPSKITYQNYNNDSLVAEISGMEKGKPRTEKFPMAKIK